MATLIRHLSLLLLFFFCLVGQGIFSEDAFAKRSRRSFSSRKSSPSTPTKSSKGSSFSSSQKTSSSSKSYSSRSKTHSQKGSVFSANSKKTSRGTSVSEASRRAESQSKFQASTAGVQAGKTYKEVVKSDSALRESLTTGNANSRNKRRTTFYNSTTPKNERYYQYRPNVIYRDPYDSFFFRYVTMTWLFHHWDNVDKKRFDDQHLQELEAEIAGMEAQELERDPSYSMEGTEPDLQYSDDELANLQDAKDMLEFEAAPEGQEGGFAWLTIFLIGLVGLGGIYFAAVRKY